MGAHQDLPAARRHHHPGADDRAVVPEHATRRRRPAPTGPAIAVQLRRHDRPRARSTCSRRSASTGRSRSRWCPGLAAREVAVGALGTVYSLSATMATSPATLVPMIAQTWSLATALSLLAWYVFAPQCLSTLVVVKRETNSWRYPLDRWPLTCSRWPTSRRSSPTASRARCWVEREDVPMLESILVGLIVVAATAVCGLGADAGRVTQPLGGAARARPGRSRGLRRARPGGNLAAAAGQGARGRLQRLPCQYADARRAGATEDAGEIGARRPAGALRQPASACLAVAATAVNACSPFVPL